MKKKTFEEELRSIMKGVALYGKKGTKGDYNRRVIMQAEGELLKLIKKYYKEKK